MKKTFVKTIALGTIIFGIGTASLFANNGNRASRQKLPAPKPAQTRQGTAPSLKHDLLGTISAISADTNILTVKDADGKETQVHVNPFTHLTALPAKADKKTAEKPKEKPRAALAFADIKVGNWVAVKKLDGETKTLEAGMIIVAQE